MRKSSVWRCLLGVEKAAIEGVRMEAAGLVVDARVYRRQRNRCGVEAVNTRIRLITRRAYGFHSAQPLIALALLSCGAHRPSLPGRAI